MLVDTQLPAVEGSCLLRPAIGKLLSPPYRVDHPTTARRKSPTGYESWLPKENEGQHQIAVIPAKAGIQKGATGFPLSAGMTPSIAAAHNWWETLRRTDYRIA